MDGWMVGIDVLPSSKFDKGSEKEGTQNWKFSRFLNRNFVQLTNGAKK
jgi:hypothetical protein